MVVAVRFARVVRVRVAGWIWKKRARRSVWGVERRSARDATSRADIELA